MANLIGTKPNQVPTNGSLGTMAFQDAETASIGNVMHASDGSIAVNTKEAGYEGSGAIFEIRDGLFRNTIVSTVTVGDTHTPVIRFRLTDTSFAGGIHISGIIRGRNNVRQGTVPVSFMATYDAGSWTVHKTEIFNTNMNVTITQSGTDVIVSAKKPGGGTGMEVAFTGMIATSNMHLESF